MVIKSAEKTKETLEDKYANQADVVTKEMNSMLAYLRSPKFLYNINTHNSTWFPNRTPRLHLLKTNSSKPKQMNYSHT